MTAENTPRCGVGRAAIYLLIAVVIVAGIALLCLNEGALIDSMPFYVNIPVVLGIFAVLLLIAIATRISIRVNPASGAARLIRRI